jgi:hypothetical protein
LGQTSTLINTLDIILQISVFSELLPVIFYVLNRKRINQKNLRVIVLLVSISFITDLISLYLVSIRKPNFTLYNSFILIEGVLLFYYFSLILKIKYMKHFIFILSVVYFLFWFYYLYNIGFKTYADLIISFENIAILILSLIYYFRQLRQTEDIVIYSNSHFWIVSAYLVYIAGTFFLFLYIPSLSLDEQQNYYWLNYIFVMIKTVMLCVAMFMKDPKQSKKFQLT